MKSIVFSGPSMPREEVEALGWMEWRPPVSQGDVHRAAQSAPAAIGIIDGYFEGEPSVWHKEILWAMSQGIPVFGAASMGALRAAELHPFGMRGVGTIFEKYRTGIYEDDDEVAVLHGPLELGYASLSLPMVNARATIEKAVELSIVSADEGDILSTTAKSIFYQKRRWEGIVSSARETLADPHALAGFEAWLPDGVVDQKQEDARKLLAEMEVFLEAGNSTIDCNFTFEWTVMWDEVASGRTGTPGHSDTSERDKVEKLVLDELRQTPDLYRQCNQRVRLKQLALGEAGRAGVEPETSQTREQLKQLRESFELYTRAQLDCWLEENDWTADQLQAALEDDQRSSAVADRLDASGHQMFIDELRLSGEYVSLKQRALEKRAAASTVHKIDIAPARLLGWYFEAHLGSSIPDDLDGYLSGVGIRSRKDFYRMAKREYMFSLAVADETP